jgi:hypothetical protein
MKKFLMVLVGVLGVAGLVAVSSAHMGGSAGPQGYGSGYGWTNGIPGSMHSGTGGGWMSRMGNWMGNMFGAGRTSHSGFDQGRPAETAPAAPDTTSR